MSGRNRIVLAGFLAGAVAIVTVAALAATGYLTRQPGERHWPQNNAEERRDSVMPTSVPSCEWPVHVAGRASRDQIDVMRCYLRALATHNVAGMKSVARIVPGGIVITKADFAHSADARSGVATIKLQRAGYAEVDPNAFPVRVTFADGARESVFMMVANAITIHSWRLMLGSEPQR